MSSALNTLKDPMSVLSRYRPHHQTHIANSNSPPRAHTRPLVTTSKVLAALDARKGHFLEFEEDDSVEFVGPVRQAVSTAAYSKVKGKNPAIPSKQTHPILSKAGTPISREAETNRHTANLNAATPHVVKSPKVLKSLPNYSYKDFSPPPTIVYTRHEEEANDLVQTLRGPLGFDMEWRAIFRAKAPERPTALVQVSDERLVLFLPMVLEGFPQKLKEIIESKSVVKMGVNIHNDGQKLFRDYGILACNLVELGSLARQVDPDFVQAFGSDRPIVGLAKVVERYCGKILVKGKERTGNWEAVLGPRMIDYAANDAHCALMVYRKIMDMATASGHTFTPAGYTSNVTVPHIATMRISSVPTSCNTTVSCSANTDVSLKPCVTSVRSQYMRAYRFWQRDKLPLEKICALLRSKEEPLKDSTVISYVVGALQSDSTLPFDMERLKALVQMEAGSWRRHREWILDADREGRGHEAVNLPIS